MSETTIFLRTYANDVPWLEFALRSIHKFATGFKEIVITIPEGQEHLLKHLTAERVITVHDAQPGYLGAQVSKLTADIHTRGDFVLHLDSDAVLTKPVTPETFLRDGKAFWMMTPWKELSGEEKRAWYHVVAKCLQEVTPYEFMRRCTIMVPRWAYAEFRAFIEKAHGMPVEKYVMNQPNHEFSEYNTLGSYLWLHHRDRIAWHDTSTMGVPEDWVRQFWSYGGITSAVRNELAMILA